ncbi:hypothetical protein SK128_027412 [Halocaridina rubra]|uniref:SH3 domain-containing protein n=1 Tax=Halocaridina rubra TaxID=373956 RepID=A0AAN8ZZV8_HALRR
MQAAVDIMYVYVARQSINGQGSEYPDMEANDIIHIPGDFLLRQKENFENPLGWLWGCNIRTGQEGYFPGRLLFFNCTTDPRSLAQRRRLPSRDVSITSSVDSQIYLPIGPGRGVTLPSSSGESDYVPVMKPISVALRRGSNASHTPPSFQHNLAQMYFLTPVLCSHCKNVAYMDSYTYIKAVVKQLSKQGLDTYLIKLSICQWLQYEASWQTGS